MSEVKKVKKLYQCVILCVICACAQLGLAAEQREINFPDISGYMTLKCDFHMHTVFSDGLVWPTVRVDEAWEQGIDAIAITDHIEYQPHKKDIPTNHNRSYEVAAELAKEKDIILIMGAEVTRPTPPGHFNALFLQDVNPLDTEDFYEVFRQASLQEAFVHWNHPMWKGKKNGQWAEHQQNLLDKGWLHGIEVGNGGHYQEQTHAMALEHGLTVFSNSDVHHPCPSQGWTAEDHRGITLVFAEERTADAIREALFAKRTIAWVGNRLIGREEHLRPMFEACLVIHKPHHINGNRVYVQMTNNCDLDIELKRIGDIGPKAISIPANSTQMIRFPGGALDVVEGLSYQAVNFEPQPETGMTIHLKLTKPVSVQSVMSH